MLSKCWAQVDDEEIIRRHFVFDKEVTEAELDAELQSLEEEPDNPLPWKYVPYPNMNAVCVGFRYDDDEAPRQIYDVQISPEPHPVRIAK